MTSVLFNPFSTNGFYKAPVTKALLATFIASHVALQIPMFSNLSKYLICLIPSSLERGDFWRLITSKLAFLDTKDAFLGLILLYQFRIFERRYGSRKFASHLIGTTILTSVLEVFVSCAVLVWFQSKQDQEGNILNFSGSLLAVGPFGMILPLFVPYYVEIPPVGGSTFGGISVSSKSMNYILGLQVIASSSANIVVGISAIVAGILYRRNILWLQKWTYVPVFCASICDRIFGWAVDSKRSPETENVILGATLELQRLQREELMEQQILRQQARLPQRNNQLRGGFFRPRGQLGRGGENFIDRLIQDTQRQDLQEQRAGAIIGFPQNRDAQQPQVSGSEDPSEENINMLMEMGFTHERAVQALRQTNNDVQSATISLLQE